MQAYSMLLPDLSYRGSASGKLDTEDADHPSMSPTDCQVLIRNGTLLTGMLDKKALGDGGGGLIHIVFNEDGYQRAASFISAVQFVVNYWMVHHGFSCGIGDTVADPATMARINTLISDAKEQVQEIIRQYQGGALEEKPGRRALFHTLLLIDPATVRLLLPMIFLVSSEIELTTGQRAASCSSAAAAAGKANGW
jgi:DNA-directed RNA polymerase II subunit RPB1